MAVSWGNAGCFDERPGRGLATAAVPGAAVETARGHHSPGSMRAERASERARRERMTDLPDHGDVLRMAVFLEGHPGWSAFWDKRDGGGRGGRTGSPPGPCSLEASTPRAVDDDTAHHGGI